MRLEVEYAGQRDEWGLWVTDASFGFFTADGSGRGQAAALNEDGTINSVSNPARLGSVLVLFGTGAGQTVPPSADGEVAGGSLPKPIAPVRATIPGLLPLQVLYAGAAPGQVAGVTQVNVRLPDTLPTPSRYPLSAIPVSVAVGDHESPGPVTVAVR